MNPNLKRYLFWITNFAFIGFAVQFLMPDDYSIKNLIRDILLGAVTAFWHNSEAKERKKEPTQNNNHK